MSGIAISYRREDTAWIAGRILDRLKQHYATVEMPRGKHRTDVFMDYDSIPVGLDFRNYIKGMLDNCDVLLVLIGPRWLGGEGTGHARIMQDGDWVRIEVETALNRNIAVIPVLIDRTPMPAMEALPSGLRDLVFRQAAIIDTQLDFDWHIERLIRNVDALLGITAGPKRGSGAERLAAFSSSEVQAANSISSSADGLTETDRSLAPDPSRSSAFSGGLRPGWRAMTVVGAGLLLAISVFAGMQFGTRDREHAATEDVYRTYNSPELGIRLAFPTNMLSLDNTERKNLKLALRDGNGQELVTITKTPIPSHKDIKQGRQDEIDALRKENYTVTYIAPEKSTNWTNWYVLSGVKHGTEFYVRRWYADDSVIAMEFAYPKSLAAVFDRVIPKMTKELVISGASSPQ